MNFTASMNCSAFTMTATNSRPNWPSRYFARTSSASPAASMMRARSAGVSGILIDHDNAALQLQHGGTLDLRHRGRQLALDLPLDLDHHALDGNAHLVDLDAALAHLHEDILHGLFGFVAQIDIQRVVAHLDLLGAVSGLDGETLVL